MAGARVIVGHAEGGAPSPATPEDAAHEYFIGRVMSGTFAPKPPVHRWRPELRERFEAELARLEDERRRQLSQHPRIQHHR